jgi:hypothetical protein
MSDDMTPSTAPVESSGRDAVADAEVEEILADLPAHHPARMKFAEGRPTAELAYLMLDRPLLMERLKQSLNDCYKRLLAHAAPLPGP